MTNKVHSQTDADRSIRRIKSLIAEGCSYREMTEILEQEGYRTLTGKSWTANNLRILVYRLRHQWKSFYALSQQRANLTLEAA